MVSRKIEACLIFSCILDQCFNLKTSRGSKNSNYIIKIAIHNASNFEFLEHLDVFKLKHEIIEN